ncbi:isochorismatase family protein, partial [Singulisphaera rosea]
AFQCTPVKNRIVLDHGGKVIDPLLKALRGRVGVVAYSLPGKEDPIRKKLYRSFRSQPTAEDRVQGRKELEAKLKDFPYEGKALPKTLAVSAETPTVEYFRGFPGLDAGPEYDHAGFWEQPIPVMKTIEVHPRDVVIYDGEGYDALRDFLKAQGIRHVLLAGYNTDMCVCLTTAGYKNLAPDFDVFLVGDATIATFPGNPSPRFATNASVSFAALNLFITQSSWVHPLPSPEKAAAR